MSGHSESKTNVHAAAVPFNRGVDKLVDTGEIDNLVESIPDFASRHTEDGAVQEDIFSTS